MPIRPFTPEDAQALAALHRSVGWSARSAAGWRWLGEDPARHRLGAPLGWIAEDEQGEPLACLGNFIQTFRLGDQTLLAGTGHSIIVSPRGRGLAPRLIRTLMDQKGLFAFYTFNANPQAAVLYRRHRIRPWPEPTHAIKLAWPLRNWPRVVSRILRLAESHTPGMLSRVLDRMPEPLMPRPRGLDAQDMPGGVVMLEAPWNMPAWDTYWRACVAGGRLLADRSPEILRHRLGNPDRTSPPVLLAAV